MSKLPIVGFPEHILCFLFVTCFIGLANVSSLQIKAVFKAFKRLISGVNWIFQAKMVFLGARILDG
ncbi:MAG: hypothetical protein ABI425_04735 [Patescibacteria group bacterium]